MERVAARLASTNGHKLAELSRSLPGWDLELLDADAFPPEQGDTYYENARGKACYGRSTGGHHVWVLGEDSGIEVEVLDGRPGLASNRWAAEGEDHVEKLLGELRGVADAARRARYVCELVCLSPVRREFRGTGVLEGRIAQQSRGSEGFGYDPIFVPEGETRTVAQLGNEWKVRNSHRACAARVLLEEIGRAV